VERQVSKPWSGSSGGQYRGKQRDHWNQCKFARLGTAQAPKPVPPLLGERTFLLYPICPFLPCFLFPCPVLSSSLKTLTDQGALGGWGCGESFLSVSLLQGVQYMSFEFYQCGSRLD
jgi:hypothetical protein